MSEVSKFGQDWRLEDPFNASHQAALDRAELKAHAADTAEPKKHRLFKKVAAIAIGVASTLGIMKAIDSRFDGDRTVYLPQGNPNVTTQQPPASLPENPGDLHITVPKK